GAPRRRRRAGGGGRGYGAGGPVRGPGRAGRPRLRSRRGAGGRARPAPRGIGGGAAAGRPPQPGRGPVSPRQEMVAARPVDPVADPMEAAEEVGLRPRRLDEFVGQTEVKEHLSIVLEAARRRSQPVDHVLFAGPPGLGKTTLAGIVASEMGAGMRVTSGPALVRAGDLAAILNDLRPGDVLFIDEIHRMGRPVEAVLYPAMEDFQLDIVIGKG